MLTGNFYNFAKFLPEGTLKRFKEYAIAFKGLKDGVHKFAYAIDSKFFALLETPLYENGNVKVDIVLTKGNQMLIFDFQISGEVESVCDNCLEPINVPVNCNGKLYVKFGEEYDEPAEDVIVLPHEEHEFNVAQIIYDLIVTSLPIRHLHPANKNGKTACNPDMLQKLKQYLVEEAPVHTSEEEETTDPRWSELKKLIDKNK